ncbi:MAG TPA: 2-amino-4-hydroxy-6-hydroxymethyldihydropteridine diphosphokinase [Chitinophagaceae bacterium]|nr:2-amino-4-hydroxy-6-hydroxymethyldihydropteridine diphosphokinase [Chitinophagaceae bacterium]
MNSAYLLIGGNMGERLENLDKTRTLLSGSCGTIVKQSSVFETSAWGKTDQPDFLNQALLVETSLSPEVLLKQLLGIEQVMGRYRGEKYGPRIIDIDIIFFNQEIIDLPDLKIPHPRMQNRRFVLAPLAEMAPGFIHPVLGKSMARLLEECTDELAVNKK